MYKRFCALCGKISHKLINNICLDCYISKIDNIKIPEKILLNECIICGALYWNKHYYLKGKKNRENFLKEIIIKLIRSEYHLDHRIFRIISIEWGEKSVVKEDREDTCAKIVIARYIDNDILYVLDKEVDIVLKYSICKRCKADIHATKKIIIQIRAGKREINMEEKREILDLVREVIDKGYEDRRFLIDIEEGKGNIIDIKLNSTAMAREIIKNIKKKYPVSILTTSKVLKVSSKKGKVYQTTIKILLPEIRKGDIIMDSKSAYYIVKGIDRKKILLVSLKNYKIKVLEEKRFFNKKYSIIKDVEFRQGIILSNNRGVIQIMDTENYNIYETSFSLPLKENLVDYVLINKEKTFIIPRALVSTIKS